MNCVEPRLFEDNTFVLSFPGANYIQSYYILKYYLPYLPKLRVVVLPLDLHSFSSFRTNRITNPIFWDNFIDFSELFRIKGFLILKGRIYLSIFDELAGRRFFVNNLIDCILRKNPQIKSISNGGSWGYNEISVERATSQRVQYHLHNRKTFDNDLLLYFKEILELCNENNISVVTLQVPVSNLYTEYANRYINKKEITNNILDNPDYNQLILKNFDYFEIYSDKPSLFEPEGDHLNKVGKYSFSKLISHRFEEIGSKIDMN
ncbi:hypothetical protein ACFL96_15220 [Thermoproteota archaeon]